MNISELHQLFISCSGITTDTRKIQSNNLFVALKGARFDANTFARKALQKGAKAVIIDNENYYIDNRTILVEDSLKCLQKLANYHRKQLKATIIALTGSNGKTTTKELLNAVVSKKFKTKATVGNFNNHIGLPLTLLNFPLDTEIGIVEMGANHKKEIEFLCTIAQPDLGYITNFGKAHLEGFGSYEGVIQAKSELYTYLKKNNKKAIVNVNDAIQVEKTKGIEQFTFSINKTANVIIDEIVANPMVQVSFNGITITSNLIGIYNATNINAAIAFAKYLDINDTLIKEAIEAYVPTNNRSEVVKTKNNTILLDAYNANPTSMEVALDNFVQLKTSKEKIAILGDMFELGKQSYNEHKNIIQQVYKNTAITPYFVGDCFYEHKQDYPQTVFLKTFEEVCAFLKNNKITDKYLLIKGSRGMTLEKTVEYL